MAIEDTANNGSLIQTQVAQLLIQPLEQASTFLAAGPTIYDTSAPLKLPKLTSSTGAGFYAEGTQIADGAFVTDELSLLPSSLKGIKTIVWLTNELIRSSVIGIDQALQQRLVTDVGNALDAAAWDGTGSSNTIKGILRQTGVATGVLNLGDADSIIDGLATAAANKVTPTHLVMTASSFAALRKLKINDDSAQYLFDPSGVQNGTALQLFGLPVILTDNIPAVSTKNRVALVDFTKVVVARDLDAEVKILDQTRGDYDSTGIRVVSRFDVGLTHAKAVTVLTEA